jgi:hypothetical protein
MLVFFSVNEHISCRLLGPFTADQSQQMLFLLSCIHPGNPELERFFSKHLEKKTLQLDRFLHA